MKKVLVLLLALMLAVTMLAVVGCGENTEEAKNLTEEADSAWETLKPKLDEFSKGATELLVAASSMDMSKLTPEVFEETDKTMKAMETEINDVIASYQKVVDLENVPENYQAYAQKRVSALNASLAAMKAGGDLLSQLQPVAESGDQNALAQAVEGAQDKIANIMSLQSEADKLEGEADELQTELEGTVE